MKRLIQIIGTASLLLAAVNFISCKPTVEASTNENNKDNSEETNQPTTETNTSQETDQTDKTEQTDNTDRGSIKIDGSKLADNDWAFATISLEDFAEKTVTIELSADMKVINSGNEVANLMWQVTAAESSYPIVCSRMWAAGTTDYTHIEGTKSDIKLGTDSKLYISASGLTVSEFKIYLKNLVIKVYETSDSSNSKNYQTFDSSSAISTSTLNWLSEDIPSLYESYKNYFDYVGFAVEYGNFGPGWGTPCELYYDEVQEGLNKHANTISLGNEFKPQFIFCWWGNSPAATENFTGSNGVTTNVPTKASLGGLSRVDTILSICKNNGLKMRGHVLLWHSQTDTAFFTEDYTSTGELVSADVMDARLEWYIKTVLNHVAEWEAANNNGEHIIWAWDVINEVTSDGSSPSAATSETDSDWLRTSDSNWYTIYNNSSTVENYYTGENYKSYDYIINAFRFANKYAPSDVKLCYNDYGGLSGTNTSYKHDSQIRVAQLILDHKNDSSWPTRFDAMGLQSHYSVKNSAAAYEKEIQDFITKGLDVQITELDIASCDNYDPETDTVGTFEKQFDSIAQAYEAFFKVFMDNKKNSGSNGVDSVTIWGLYDESTWLNTPGQIKWIGESIQYPLLFSLENNVNGTTTTITTSDGATSLGTLDLYDQGDSFTAKDAFFKLIDLANDYSN